ncbi:DUF5955 family protein [Actinocorallia longicatena]|uniref:Uncharacterized protein n=1 Tax=Actinocorallia longicatena TaxID=111803 RepID=A0ABP6Q0G9_9ACTN
MPHAPTTPLAAALDRVEELLGTHADALEEPEHAARDLRDLREEATSARPDVARRDSALSRLTHRVSTVAPLLTAVESVRNLLA